MSITPAQERLLHAIEILEGKSDYIIEQSPEEVNDSQFYFANSLYGSLESMSCEIRGNHQSLDSEAVFWMAKDSFHQASALCKFTPKKSSSKEITKEIKSVLKSIMEAHDKEIWGLTA